MSREATMKQINRLEVQIAQKKRLLQKLKQNFLAEIIAPIEIV